MPQPVRLRAVIEEAVDHAPGLRSLVVAPERPAPRFRPGQFLHLALDPWDPSAHWPDSRPFSIASPPDVRDRLRITVSAVGGFTSRIMAARPGDAVWLKLPYGEFEVRNDDGCPAVLLAGGTGVAPFVSLLASRRPLTGPVRLLYGARRPDLLIYRQALDEAAGRTPHLRWTAFLEEGEMDGAERGRPSVGAALAAAAEAGSVGAALFYLSGPPEMMAELACGLDRAGIDARRVITDAWS